MFRRTPGPKTPFQVYQEGVLWSVSGGFRRQAAGPLLKGLQNKASYSFLSQSCEAAVLFLIPGTGSGRPAPPQPLCPRSVLVSHLEHLHPVSTCTLRARAEHLCIKHRARFQP